MKLIGSDTTHEEDIWIFDCLDLVVRLQKK